MDKSSGLIAEYHVICELYRNQYKCVQSPNPQNVGWDIIVIETPSKDKLDIKLQVKGVRWQEGTGTKPKVTGNFSKSADFDYLVIVVIDFAPDKPYLTYIIPKESLIDRETKNQKSGLLLKENEQLTDVLLYKGRSIAFSTFKDIKIKSVMDHSFLDNWTQIIQSM